MAKHKQRSPKRGQQSQRHGARRTNRRETSAPTRSQAYWLYGRHAVEAALANPVRQVHRVVALPGTPPPAGAAAVEAVDGDELGALLPADAVHQGLAAQVSPLPDSGLEDACTPDGAGGNIVVVLDRVSDPRNIGAVLRSAAAFDARALVLPDRHTPAESAAMAKAASGALELVPVIRVTNLARALDRLAELGYWRYGLTAGEGAALDELDLAGNCVLVLGAEGEGLRRLTAEHCDVLAHLPIADRIDSLNVSAAAAIALFAARRMLERR